MLLGSQVREFSVFYANPIKLRNLEENDVFERVVDEAQATISTKWAITEKFNDQHWVLKRKTYCPWF